MRARRAKGPSRAELAAAAERAAAGVAVPGRVDVCVVGAGAAGLAAAIAAIEGGASVVALEAAAECGRTILATGNGRCNFANERLEAERYNDPAFVRAVCGEPEAFLARVLGFFRGCGMAWASEDGRLYPLSRQAASVREVLLARAGAAGAVLAPMRQVTTVERADDGWHLAFDELFGQGRRGSLVTQSVIVTCGGGAALVADLGLEVAPWEPVLCSLACEEPLAELDGRRAHATCRLLRDGAEVVREDGEVLFREYGLSGIAMFDFSRVARAGDVVSLDLTCGADVEGLSPAGVLDPKIAQVLGADALLAARDLRFVVTGVAEPARAQVSRGGVLTGQLDPQTLEARDLPGLFVAGEAANVDGACGGFNLAWAWASGLVAGAAAAR